METNPAGNDVRPVESVKKIWKDYVGWAGFVVTAFILIQQIFTHGQGIWYYCFGEGTQYIGALGDLKYSLLYHITTVFDVLRTIFFTLHPLAVLVVLLLRKRIVPRLLVIFAGVAVFTTASAEVLYNLLAAEYNGPVYVSLTSVVYLVIDLALVLFYSKSKRFRALFIK